ncbi:MAG TPA: TonB-dependent receptor [Gemmatimonadaceae bacterium]|nr:TonB-dependent receptor [Gemmatimonadaceae bacterium]
MARPRTAPPRTPAVATLRALAAAAILVPVAPAIAAAQDGALRGRVLIAADGTPVAGATVVVVGTTLGALTDSAGVFDIPVVPAGLHDVEARRVGLTAARTAVTVRPAEAAEVTLLAARGPLEIAGVTVIGRTADALSRLPGSAAVVPAATLRALMPISANEVLRTVPGVHVQEEEGAGLRANIGIRGLDPDRSRTVLVLEDGVPVALAPYGEPEMYYSPPIDRMERVEVVKGSGSILFGPQTIGGVVNYVTADAPVRPAGKLQLQHGAGGSRFLKAGYGGSWGAARGIVGAFQRRADDIDGLHYDVRDVTAKVGVRTRAGDFGLKGSIYHETSNATYVGLTDSLFRAAPHEHPRPDDRLAVSRAAVTGSHDLALGGATTLRTSAYGYRTTRDWTRRDYVYNATGQSLVFRNTTGSRDRAFDVVGIEPRVSTSWSLGGLRNALDLGARAHLEHARDKHIDGAVDGDATVVRDDEKRTGRALAAYIQNRLFLTPTLHVTPGLRFERFSYERRILRTRVRRSDGTTTTRAPEDVNLPPVGDVVSELIPGIGAAWAPSAVATVFAGAHRGFAPPRTKDALIYQDPTLPPGAQLPDVVSLQLDAERSWNYELGTRLRPRHWLGLEATAFLLDFSNQIIEPSLSAGAVADAALANQGATRHLGVELATSLDIGAMLARSYGLTLDLGYTLVDAEFSRDRFMRLSATDTVNVRGNALPYAPQQRAHGALTLDLASGMLVRLDGTYVGAQYSDNFETVAGSANGRVGRIPAYQVLDVTTRLPIPRLRGAELVASVKNLTDELYIASRRPEGIKPGLPRLATVGVSWEF